MNIDQLPNGLRELAEKRRSEDDSNDQITDLLYDAFEWGRTIEGFYFWLSVDKSDFCIYEGLYPTHQWIEDYPGEYDIIYDPYGNKRLRKLDDAARSITPAVLANGYYAGEGVNQEIKDAWVKGYEYACRNYGIDNTVTNVIPDNTFKNISKNPPDVVYVHKDGTEASVFNIPDDGNTGIKESQGKLSYELDWEFVEAMAIRMSKNKGKYEPYNWKKPIEVEHLKQAIVRHVVEMMKGNYSDDGVELGHIIALSCNAQMLFYQLNNYKD